MTQPVPATLNPTNTRRANIGEVAPHAPQPASVACRPTRAAHVGISVSDDRIGPRGQLSPKSQSAWSSQKSISLGLFLRMAQSRKRKIMLAT